MGNSRFYAIDYIKFFAILAIVCGHTAPFYEMSVKLFFLIDTLPKIAVTYFFAISGFLFGKKIIKTEKPYNYLQKYSKKIAALYLSWSLFYFIYDCSKILFEVRSYYKSAFGEIIARFSLIRILSDVLYFGYGDHHLWFLTSLLWSIAILFIFIKFNRLNELLVISFLLNIIGLFGNSYAGIIGLGIPTRDAIFYGLFYCTLGCSFAMHENAIRQKIAGLKINGIVLAFMLFTALQIMERTILIKYFNGVMFNDDYVIASIPLTICLLLLILRIPEMGKNSFLTQIGANAFGIYVLHPFIIDSLKYIIIKIIGVNMNTIFYQIIFTPIVIFISYFVYAFLQQLKLWMSSHILHLKEDGEKAWL